MALANALVGPALAAMAAPAPEVPFEEQLAQVAAEAEFKRLHSFEHGEALAKELAEAWAEHKDKAMEHAEKGLVDDGGDYTFEIESKLGATEQDVYKHLPEELLKMKERNKMWAMRRNADSCNYIFRINYTQEAKKILERLEKEQEHKAKKQRCANPYDTANEALAAAKALDKAKKKYGRDSNTETANLVVNLHEVAKQTLTELGKAALEAYNKSAKMKASHLLAIYKEIHEDYNGGAVSSTTETLIKAIKLHLGIEEVPPVAPPALGRQRSVVM